MELMIPRVAGQIQEVKAQPALIAIEVETMLDTHPDIQVLISTPGVGITTDTTILLTAGDFSSFLTSGHLVGYCDIAPLIRRSGSPSVANSPHSISQQATQKCSVPIKMGTWLTHKHFSCRTVLANNPFRVIRGSP